MPDGYWGRDTVHLIAHRGGAACGPENSPEAIAEAARRGATDVEIDVNMTADGVLVAIHDGALPGGGWISERPFRELSVPALDDVLAATATAGIGLYLDVKQLLPDGAVTLRAALDRFGLADRTVGASFRSDLALALKREAGITTSVLFHDPGIDLHSLVTGTGCDFVHPCFDVFPDPLALFTPEWAAAARRVAGIIAWNTDDVATARTVYSRGATGVCSDDPAVLVAARAR